MREKWERFASPHVVLGRDEYRVLFRLVELTKLFLASLVAACVTDHAHDPTLEVYWSDGTPVSVAERVVLTTLGGVVVRRIGKKLSSSWWSANSGSGRPFALERSPPCACR